MQEAAESQEKLCMIHYKQMDKPDRDPNERAASRAGMPPGSDRNSPTPSSLRKPSSSCATSRKCWPTAKCAWAISTISRGSFASAANRLGGVVDQYPLYSRADEALWLEADSYTRLGPRFRQQAGDTYARLVRDYPLSEYADQAKNAAEDAGDADSGCRSRGRSAHEV